MGSSVFTLELVVVVVVFVVSLNALTTALRIKPVPVVADDLSVLLDLPLISRILRS